LRVSNGNDLKKTEKNEQNSICYFKWAPVRVNHDAVSNSDMWIGDLFGEYIYASQQNLGGVAVILTVDLVHRIGEYGFPDICSANDCSGGDYSCIFSTAITAATDKNKPRRVIKDAAHVDMDLMGISTVVHFITPLQRKQLGREQINKINKGSNVKILNSYKTNYYPKVLSSLKQRGVEVLASLPDATANWRRINSPPVSSLPDNGWYKIGELEFSSANSVPFETTENLIDASTSNIGTLLHSQHCILYIYKVFGNNYFLFISLGQSVESNGFAAKQLPTYSTDMSELFLSSIIERKSNSNQLFVTTFIFSPRLNLESHLVSIENNQLSEFIKYRKKSRQTKYGAYAGRRIESTIFYCKIKHSDSSSSYVTTGHFMPNGLTTDANANGLLDVLRCPLQELQNGYRKHLESDELLQVEIISGIRTNLPLVSFTIPWKSRRTGYMLYSPPQASTFNAWKGLHDISRGADSMKSESSAFMKQEKHDDLFMCVPGMESPIDRRILPLYTEFIEHHTQLGVDHMFIVASLTWTGPNMKRLLRSLKTYIDEGSLTVTSHAAGIAESDLTYSFNGISLYRDPFKVMFTNMCLYYAKGSADYVGIWDFGG
jgi:hypothetical protein